MGFGKENGDQIEEGKTGVEKTVIIFGGVNGLKKSKGCQGNQKSREPVGLAESGENAVLDVLHPDIFVDTQTFEDGIKRNQSGRGENGGDEMSDGLGLVGEMGDEGVVKDDIGNRGHEATVETRIITPKTGMGVDGNDGGNNLGG